MEEQAITSQQVATEPVQATPEAAPVPQPVPEQAAPEQEIPTNVIPEKFRGKDPIDIIKAYSELEREKSRLANRVHEIETKNKEYETYYRAQPTQQTQQPVLSKEVKTPEDIYEEEWQNDPKVAAKNYVLNKQKYDRQQNEFVQSAQILQAMHAGSMKGYEDVPELMPVVSHLAGQLAPIVNPEYANNPLVLEALVLMARGATIDSRLQKAKSEGASVAQSREKAKEQTFMESSSASSGGVVDVEDLSVTELRKILPKKQSE